MPKVSIAIQPDVFDRFSDLNFKPSQAIAEFIDNAIQSYLDNKNNNTFYHPGYKLTIDIHIKWSSKSKDHKTYAESIEIRDNGAGISMDKFDHALETGHRPPFNEGLNEYGMGMKVAAYWLSQNWEIKSKSFTENVERTVSLDVNDIVKNKRTELQYEEKIVNGDSSYTIVKLHNLHDKNNFTKAKFGSIKQELESIYRAYIRRNEIQINIQQDDMPAESLQFQDLKILNHPYWNTPDAKPIEWKVPIHCSMFGKEIIGYIAILEQMSEYQSGLVVLRRGRVIVGESKDHSYHPECIFGASKKSFEYNRLYGEIEIKGFNATFNKNGFSNLEELETMLGTLKSTLKIEGYKLTDQAKNFRVRSVSGSGSGSNSSTKPVSTTSSGSGSTLTGTNNTSSSSSISTSTGSTGGTSTSNSVSTTNGTTTTGKPATNTGSTSTPPTVTSVTYKKIANKLFDYNGMTVVMELVSSDVVGVSVALDMGDFPNNVKCIVSKDIKKKCESNNSIQDIIMLMAIGMFESQMSNDDSCEGLIKHVIEKL